MRNPFRLVRHLFIKTDEREYEARRTESRIISGTPTEFIFCNRRFGAVIIDVSNSGMKLSCEKKVAVGATITLVDPSISGKIVWRDDKKNLMGIKFVEKESFARSYEDSLLMKAS